MEVLINLKHKMGKRQQSQQIKHRSNRHILNDGASALFYFPLAVARADLMYTPSLLRNKTAKS